MSAYGLSHCFQFWLEWFVLNQDMYWFCFCSLVLNAIVFLPKKKKKTIFKISWKSNTTSQKLKWSTFKFINSHNATHFDHYSHSAILQLVFIFLSLHLSRLKLSLSWIKISLFQLSLTSCWDRLLRYGFDQVLERERERGWDQW